MSEAWAASLDAMREAVDQMVRSETECANAIQELGDLMRRIESDPELRARFKKGQP